MVNDLIYYMDNVDKSKLPKVKTKSWREYTLKDWLKLIAQGIFLFFWLVLII